MHGRYILDTIAAGGALLTGAGTGEATLAQEHRVLLESATALITDLEEFRSRLRHRRVTYSQHYDFAERARALAMFLRPALDLAAVNEYLAAFALLRSGLEHHLTDRLLFLARSYKEVITQVKKPIYQQWHSDWKSKKAGMEDIVKLQWKDGNVVVVRSGLHPTGAKKGRRGRTISFYFFRFMDYDPFVGPPKAQGYLARDFTTVKKHQEYAEEQRRVYGQAISWEAIKSNLVYNSLCGAETIERFDVHYRFLSAFVHSVPAAFKLLYGHNQPPAAQRHDHYASELVLLYINKIASEELKALKRMAGRTPRVELTDWPSVEAHVRAADAVAAHLWFPGDRPNHYDYVEEANSRGLRGDKLVPANRRPTPAQLKVTQVHYYRNPLHRLIRMHQTIPELTGFTYVSRWPRQDAHLR